MDKLNCSNCLFRAPWRNGNICDALGYYEKLPFLIINYFVAARVKPYFCPVLLYCKSHNLNINNYRKEMPND